MSLRRLGEELYRPAKQTQGGGDSSRDIAYIQSNDPQVRFLSALIILKTDTQGETIILYLLLLPYTGLGPFQALKVRSKLVRLG